MPDKSKTRLEGKAIAMNVENQSARLLAIRNKARDTAVASSDTASVSAC